jgi:hexulose-6-phosphate isomerase
MDISRPVVVSGSIAAEEFLMKDRRTFLKLLAAAAGTAQAAPAYGRQVTAQGPAAAGSSVLKKSTLISMLPKERTYAERFAIARAAGFEAIEMRTMPRDAEAAEIREASQKTGLKIHSVMNEDHWRLPLSSSDPDVVARTVKGMETSFRNAVLWGADTVLLVPAVVDANTSYKDAWTRSQRVIRERLLPMATAMKVVIGVEEVWNKFLLSPLEMARYVDEFESPWVRAYFDVGNVLIWAFPQDWIRTLGSRIVRIHIKDFSFDRQNGRFAWKNIGEGDIDWPEVRRALADIKYSGYVTTEVSGGDEAYLKDLSERVDRFFAGQKPVTAGAP